MSDDRGTPGTQGHRGVQRLVGVGRDVVADDRLAGGGAEQREPEAIADLEREIHPTLAPRADQPISPLLAHDGRDALGRGRGQAPEAVAVEVDERVVGDDESLPQVGKGIPGVALLGVLPGRADAGIDVIAHARRLPRTRAPRAERARARGGQRETTAFLPWALAANIAESARASTLAEVSSQRARATPMLAVTDRGTP